MEQEVTSFEFQPLAKSPAYVCGEQLANLALVKIAFGIASFVYSKLPSFSLPGAHASSTSACDALSVCTTPTGSYEQSCHRPKLTYLPEEGECLLETRCETLN